MMYLSVLMLIASTAFLTWYITKVIVSKKSKKMGFNDGFKQGVASEKHKYKLSDSFIAQWDYNHMKVQGINPLNGVHICEKEHNKDNDIIPEFSIHAVYNPNDDRPAERNFDIKIHTDYTNPVDTSIKIFPNGKVSDGYHTFDELYYYRMLYNANMVNMLVLLKVNYPKLYEGFDVIKSKKHFDGQPCYGGGWFIVVIKTPWGQISNHYKLEHWDNFKCRATKRSWKWDNHDMKESTERMIRLNKFVCNTYEFPHFK